MGKLMDLRPMALSNEKEPIDVQLKPLTPLQKLPSSELDHENAGIQIKAPNEA